MKFAPSTEQRDFAASLRDLLAAADTPTVVRAWASGDYAGGRKLWGRLADAGVTALGLSGADGGYGASPVDLVIGFEELGRAAVPGPLVESIAVAPVLLGGTPASAVLSRIGAGDAVVSIAMPPAVPFAVDGRVADATYIVVGDDVRSAVLGSDLESSDKSRRLVEVSSGDLVASGVNTARAFDIGALATAAQLLGAGHALLDGATTYAQQRVQFGRPIGQFQAVKHQLADAMVGLELARPLLFAAALAYADQAPTVARDISAAKVACSDAAYRTSRASLQVHGAIGYTAEHDLSLWLTKVRALTFAWGTQALHRARVLESL